MDNVAGNTTVNRNHAASNEFNYDATITNNAILRSSSTSDHHPPTSTTTTASTTTTGTTCPRLEIHSQKDANLVQFHPNIYIPEMLLEYPDHLIKYGGGGKK
jgi:GMP synthase-like glutamine amidotransferase